MSVLDHHICSKDEETEGQKVKSFVPRSLNQEVQTGVNCINSVLNHGHIIVVICFNPVLVIYCASSLFRQNSVYEGPAGTKTLPCSSAFHGSLVLST